MQILTLTLVIGSVLASTLLRYLWTVDAGDLASAATLNQLAHPPGYPLYILIGKFLYSFLHLPSMTFALSLSSALASLASIFILFRLCQLLYRALYKSESPWYLTSMATLTVCFIPLWWIYSISQEVFMMSVLFISATILIIVEGLVSKKVPRWHFVLGLLALSFGIFHQYILLLLVPVFIFSYWYHYRRLRFVDVIVFILLIPIGFSPYLLFLRATVDTQIPRIWYATASLRDLLFIAGRQNYGTFSLFGSLGKAPIDVRLESVGNYFKDIFQLWNILLLPIVIGIVVLFRKTKLLGFVLLLVFIAFGPGLFLVYPLPLTNLMSHAIFQRFLLYSFPFLGLYLFVGMSFFDSLVKKLTQRNPLVLLSTIGIVSLIPFLFLYKYFVYFRSLSNYDGLERYSRNMLDFVPQHSLLVVKDDPFAMPVEYMSFVKKYRADVIVFPAWLIEDKKLYDLNSNYLKSKKLVLPSKGPDSERLNNFLLLNQKSRPVFTNFHMEGFKQFKQIGPLYQVTDNRVPVDVQKAQTFYKDAVYISSISKPIFPLYGISEIQKYLARSINFYISYFSKQNKLNETLMFYKLLNNVEPTYQTQYAIGVVFYKMKDCPHAYTTWEQGFRYYTEPLFAQRLSQLSAACFKNLQRANFWNVVYEYSKQSKYGKQ